MVKKLTYTTNALKGDKSATNYVKTIYDPSIWTDDRLVNTLKEALQDVANKNNGVVSEGRFNGLSSEGYSIEGFFRGGKIDTFYFVN